MGDSVRTRALGLELHIGWDRIGYVAQANGIEVVLRGPVFEALPDITESRYISSEIDQNGTPVTTIDSLQGDRYRIRYCDGTEFVVDRGNTRVSASWPESSTEEDTLVYLFGPVLGILLRLRGVTCLHASAVVVGDGALAFTGSAHAGKSSIAAAFSRMGIPVLTDDVVALDDRGDCFIVPPGPARILLWPESVSALWGAPDALSLVVPGWDKKKFAPGHPDFRFCDRALPLRAVYVLAERTERASIEIGPLGGAAGLVALIANTFGNRSLDAERRAAEFETLGRLVRLVPLRQVHAPDDRARLGELCEAILEDYRGPAARDR